ncbi:MAG TPA: hypothetical protein VF647_07330 [Longimicrobium sp.]|jgi:hypothetical protein
MRGLGALGWLLIAVVWMIGTFGGGAALAWLYKRLHPELAFYKLWALWSAVLSGAAVLVLAFV